MSSVEYLRAVDEVLASVSPRRKTSPAALLEEWEQLVEFCTAGYYMGWYELANDLSVRAVIEAMLSDERVSRHPEALEVSARVAAIDGRYRALLVAIPGRGDFPWWASHIPRYGGAELVDDAQRLFHMNLELRED